MGGAPDRPSREPPSLGSATRRGDYVQLPLAAASRTGAGGRPRLPAPSARSYCPPPRRAALSLRPAPPGPGRPPFVTGPGLMNGRGGAGARRRARAAPAPPPPRSAWPLGQGRNEGRVLAATWGGAAGAPIGRPVWPTGRSARADWSARAGGVSSEWEGAAAPPLGTLIHYNFFFLLLSPPDPPAAAAAAAAAAVAKGGDARGSSARAADGPECGRLSGAPSSGTLPRACRP